jgi:hypothetical protein
MTYKDEEKRIAYQKAYWEKPENKERNRLNAQKHYAKTKRQLIVYWLKKYMQVFNCRESECAHLTIEQMKEDINSGLCRI